MNDAVAIILVIVAIYVIYIRSCMSMYSCFDATRHVTPIKLTDNRDRLYYSSHLEKDGIYMPNPYSFIK
jgi:hypothetical protein